MIDTQWTEGGPRLGERILSREDFQQWLDAGGERTLRGTVDELPMNRIFGEARARRKLFGTLDEMMNQDERFRRDLQRSLATLPLVIHGVARLIVSGQLRTLVRMDHVRRLIAVPRGIVRDWYPAGILQQLGPMPNLTGFDGLPQTILTRQARDSEREFFRRLKKVGQHSFRNPKVMITGVNPFIDWGVGAPPGHYYLGETGLRDLSRPENRDHFREEVRGWMEEMDASLSVLGRDSLGSISRHLRRMLAQAGTGRG